jgi:large subunit ribosomal protein L25
MAMATTSPSLSLSGGLPPRLMNFFAKYPPKLYSAKYTGESIPLTRTQKKSQQSNAPSSALAASTASITSSSDPNTPMLESTSTPPPETPSSAPVPPADDLRPNPFLPWHNPKTGRWRGPPFSLRRQAELVKIAQKYGVESLLPAGRKSSAFKEARLLEKGLRVKGTGEGQRVKGHKWEREMPAKLEARRKAMEAMPELIRSWKEVSRFLVVYRNVSWILTFYCRGTLEGIGRSGRNDFRTKLYNNLHHAQIHFSDSLVTSVTFVRKTRLLILRSLLLSHERPSQFLVSISQS